MRTPFRHLVAGMFALLAVAILTADAAQPEETFVLRSGRKVGDVDRVVALLEVGGEVIGTADGKVQREEMSVVCNLCYDEKTLDVPAGSTDRWRSVRYYDKAAAVVKVGEDGSKPTLRPQRRLIGTEVDSRTATLFSPRGTLTRDELELIDVLGNSLLLDRLLPQKPVPVDRTWKQPDTLMAALLGLDEVARSDVQSVLKEVTARTARFEMAGRVEGAINGASTEIELKAKYRFDRRSKRIDWFALLVKEKRSIGHVADGVDVVARVQARILPNAGSTQLTDATLKNLSLKPTAELSQLAYRSAEGGWQFTHDRRWHVTSDRRDLAVLRLVDRGELVAQCNVSPLLKHAPGRPVTLSDFQNDIQKALGESFGEFVQASQWGTAANYQAYRVVVRGKVEELPIQWNYYLVTDEHGHRVVFAFSVEGKLIERFSKADEKLVRSLRFLRPQVAKKGEK